MSRNDNTHEQPVVVTGEERKHPALRLLARACIELARQKLAGQERQSSIQDEHAEAADRPVSRREVNHG